MLPLREHLLSTISCVHSTVAHVQNAYEAVQPEDIVGEDEVKPDRTPSRARPVRSTIPQPSSHTIASSKPLAGEDPTPLNSDGSQGDTPRDTNSEPPIRRSLLVRKPQGFSAEGGVSASTTGGVTAPCWESLTLTIPRLAISWSNLQKTPGRAKSFLRPRKNCSYRE